jgi:hypothetical protein
MKNNKNITAKNKLMVNKLNSDMDFCGLSIEIQKGFMFFMGASINIGINESVVDLSPFTQTDEEQRETFMQIIHSYSKSSGIFEDYGELHDGVFLEAIYTFNTIFFSLNGSGTEELDSNLRSVKLTKNSAPSIMNKCEPHKGLMEKYKNANYNLNTFHNLIEDVFAHTGKELHENEFDLQKSYEAGYAYFCMQSLTDIKGSLFLYKTMYNMLTPLYKALYSYPFLNFVYPDILLTNHIFSNTLQLFYGGIDPTITKAIHRFHQFIFYQSNSIELREVWDFKLENGQKMQDLVFINAQSIRETDVISLREHFLAFDDFMNPALKNAKMTLNEFYYQILVGIKEKYNINPCNKEQNHWNNLGDFIQFLGILFYETCLHAIVLDEIIETEQE